MKFLDPLVVEHLDEGKWRLWFEFRCVADDGRGIYVPAGFKTDMLSIPRMLWSMFPPTGNGGKAAIVHDWLLMEGLLPRAKCADFFLEALQSLNVPDEQATAMYLGVRAQDLLIEATT